MKNFKNTCIYIYFNSCTPADIEDIAHKDLDEQSLIDAIQECVESSMQWDVARYAFEKTTEDVCIQICNILIDTCPKNGDWTCDDAFGHCIKKSTMQKAKKCFNQMKKADKWD